MIDIHCHPLPGVDDGAKTFEVAVAMCKIAAEDGITHLVATPHSNYSYAFDARLNRQLLAELQAKIGEKPKLLLGCDFHLSYDNIQICIQNSGEFTINQTPYLLVELPDQFIPDHLNRVYYDIQVAGLRPIITHPERNPLLQRRPELLEEWISLGCLVQVTAQSYLGGFGSKARKFSEMLLDAGAINFFATDAHDVRRRPPLLSRCYRKVAKAKGEEVAEHLLQRNPEAVINGLPLPPAPETAEFEGRLKKRGLFARLFGR